MSGFKYQRLSSKLIRRQGWHLPVGSWTHAHWCPACEQIHDFAVEQPFSNGAKWTFDGNALKPTFGPSMNIRVGPFPDNHMEVCHYFLQAGQIKYLADCTHAMAGKTVELPDMPANKMNAEEVE